MMYPDNNGSLRMRTIPFHTRYLSLANGAALTCFMVGFIFSIRAVSSISIALLIITGILATTAKERKASWAPELSGLMAACMFFYAAECLAAALHPPFTLHAHKLQVKSSLVFIPVACYVSFPVMQTGKMYFYRIYCLLLAAAAVYCLLFQWMSGAHGSLNSPFLYHELVSPLGQHAVFFSLYLFFAVVLLLEDLSTKCTLFLFPAALTLLLFFCAFIFLLASKLIILLCIGYFIYKLFHGSGVQRNWKKGLAASVILAGFLIIFTSNGVHRRFRELVTGNMELLQQEKFSPDIYFNAWEFRLLQFRFVPEILDEDHAWVTGTGPGRAQELLNGKYTIAHMYAGEPGSGKIGYLEYHTHNQWLQSLLEAGLPALIAFAAMIFFLVRVCIRQRSTLYTCLAIALFSFSFTDALLASQFGIVLMLFFIHFLYHKPGVPA